MFDHLDFSDLKTRLPIVKKELYEGLIASDNKALLGNLYEKLAIINPMVFLYITAIFDRAGAEAAGSALMLYHILETQAECNEFD